MTKAVAEKTERKNPQAVALGRLGGKAISERGPEYMRKIGRRGAKARWKDGTNKN